MTRRLRQALGGVMLAGALGLCAASAMAFDGPARPAPAAASAVSVPAVTAPAATAPAIAAPAVAAPAVVAPATSTVPASAQQPVSAAATASANPGASSQSATPYAQPAAAAQPVASPSPSLAALSPPGRAPLPAAQGAAPAISPPAAGPSAISSAPASGAPGLAGASAAPTRTPGRIALLNTKSEAVARDPLNWAVMVYKSRHQLVVYFQGHFYKSYDAVFGRNLDHGTKEWAGDRRTPEGVYRIIRKRPNRRWRYFLQINYPNNYDHAQYEDLVSEGEVPRIRGRAIGEGGAIGIHGTDEAILNSGKVDWTTGCISVDNGAIDELEALLPIGTLVIIKP